MTDMRAGIVGSLAALASQSPRCARIRLFHSLPWFADTLIGWKEEEKLSRIVDHAELKKNNYNISPKRTGGQSEVSDFLVRLIGEDSLELPEA